MATEYASVNMQAPASRRARVGNVRWGIAVLLGVGVLINYVDRINISVATKPLETSFHLTTGEMGIILSSFL